MKHIERLRDSLKLRLTVEVSVLVKNDFMCIRLRSALIGGSEPTSFTQKVCPVTSLGGGG